MGVGLPVQVQVPDERLCTAMPSGRCSLKSSTPLSTERRFCGTATWLPCEDWGSTAQPPSMLLPACSPTALLVSAASESPKSSWGQRQLRALNGGAAFSRLHPCPAMFPAVEMDRTKHYLVQTGVCSKLHHKELYIPQPELEGEPQPQPVCSMSQPPFLPWHSCC